MDFPLNYVVRPENVTESLQLKIHMYNTVIFCVFLSHLPFQTSVCFSSSQTEESRRPVGSSDWKSRCGGKFGVRHVGQDKSQLNRCVCVCVYVTCCCVCWCVVCSCVWMSSWEWRSSADEPTSPCQRSSV